MFTFRRVLIGRVCPKSLEGGAVSRFGPFVNIAAPAKVAGGCGPRHGTRHCAYVSGLLDENCAYAGVLSGYTVAFLAVEQIDDPAHVFESCMARGAAIIIGKISGRYRQ